MRAGMTARMTNRPSALGRPRRNPAQHRHESGLLPATVLSFCVFGLCTRAASRAERRLETALLTWPVSAALGSTQLGWRCPCRWNRRYAKQTGRAADRSLACVSYEISLVETCKMVLRRFLARRWSRSPMLA